MRGLPPRHGKVGRQGSRHRAARANGFGAAAPFGNLMTLEGKPGEGCMLPELMQPWPNWTAVIKCPSLFSCSVLWLCLAFEQGLNHVCPQDTPQFYKGSRKTGPCEAGHSEITLVWAPWRLTHYTSPHLTSHSTLQVL